MSEGVAFFAEVLMLVSSLGGLFGLTFYLGYRAGQRNPIAQMAEALNQMASNHADAIRGIRENFYSQTKATREWISALTAEQINAANLNPNAGMGPFIIDIEGTRLGQKFDEHQKAQAEKAKEEENAIPEA
jgi:hypothetical protein